MPYRLRREYFRKRKKKHYVKENTFKKAGYIAIGIGSALYQGGKSLKEIIRKRRENKALKEREKQAKIIDEKSKRLAYEKHMLKAKEAMR